MEVPQQKFARPYPKELALTRPGVTGFDRSMTACADSMRRQLELLAALGGRHCRAGAKETEAQLRRVVRRSGS